MIKKHLPDIAVIVFLGLLIPLFVVKKPVISYNIPHAKDRASQAGKQQEKTTLAQQGSRAAEQQAGKQQDKTTLSGGYAKLEERNIFSMDGTYKSAKDKVAMPENPYTFIGVLGSNEKRAVFREYTGHIITLKKGDKLIDDFVIKDIDNLYVKLTKGKGKAEKEMRIFYFKDKDENKKGKEAIKIR